MVKKIKINLCLILFYFFLVLTVISLVACSKAPTNLRTVVTSNCIVSEYIDSNGIVWRSFKSTDKNHPVIVNTPAGPAILNYGDSVVFAR